MTASEYVFAYYGYTYEIVFDSIVVFNLKLYCMCILALSLTGQNTLEVIRATFLALIMYGKYSIIVPIFTQILYSKY